MSVVDLEVIAENLAELLTAVTDQASKYYTLLIDPTPQDVSIQVYNSSNQLVTVIVPNLAKAKSAMTGTVNPEGSVTASVGAVYVNTADSTVYIKVLGSGNTGWAPILTSSSITPILAQYVLKSTTINNKSLSSNITLTASDVGALSSATVYGQALALSGSTLSLNDQNGNTLNSVQISTATIETMETLSTSTISLQSNKAIYYMSVPSNTTFTFDVSNLGSLSGKVVTFELYLEMTTVYTLTFPASVTWISQPSFTNTGSYLLVFRTLDGGSTWIGNLEAQW